MILTYEGTYSIDILAPLTAPFWSCWPVNDEKALTSEAQSSVAARMDAVFMMLRFVGRVSEYDFDVGRRRLFVCERLCASL